MSKKRPSVPSNISRDITSRRSQRDAPATSTYYNGYGSITDPITFSSLSPHSNPHHLPSDGSTSSNSFEDFRYHSSIGPSRPTTSRSYRNTTPYNYPYSMKTETDEEDRMSPIVGMLKRGNDRRKRERDVFPPMWEPDISPSAYKATTMGTVPTVEKVQERKSSNRVMVKKWIFMMHELPVMFFLSVDKSPLYDVNFRLYDLTLSATHGSVSWVLGQRKGMMLPEMLDEHSYNWEIIALNDNHQRGQDERVSPDEVFDDLDSGWRLKVYLSSPTQDDNVEEEGQGQGKRKKNSKGRVKARMSSFSTLALEIDRFQLLPTKVLGDAELAIMKDQPKNSMKQPTPARKSSKPSFPHLFPLLHPDSVVLPTCPPLPKTIKDVDEYTAPLLIENKLKERKLRRVKVEDWRRAITKDERKEVLGEMDGEGEDEQERSGGEYKVGTREERGAAFRFVKDRFPEWQVGEET